MKIESFVVKDEGQDLEIEMGFSANQNTFAQITLRFELIFFESRRTLGKFERI